MAGELAETPGVITRENPPCLLCGGPHPFDTTVPSDTWNRVIRAQGLPEYLCTTCIIRAFALAGVSFTAELWSARIDQFAGLPIAVTIGTTRPTKLSRVVALRSGGNLTLSASVDLCALSSSDRKCLRELLETLDKYEALDE